MVKHCNLKQNQSLRGAYNRNAWPETPAHSSRSQRPHSDPATTSASGSPTTSRSRRYLGRLQSSLQTSETPDATFSSDMSLNEAATPVVQLRWHLSRPAAKEGARDDAKETWKKCDS